MTRVPTPTSIPGDGVGAGAGLESGPELWRSCERQTIPLGEGGQARLQVRLEATSAFRRCVAQGASTSQPSSSTGTRTTSRIGRGRSHHAQRTAQDPVQRPHHPVGRRLRLARAALRPGINDGAPTWASGFRRGPGRSSARSSRRVLTTTTRKTRVRRAVR